MSISSAMDLDNLIMSWNEVIDHNYGAVFVKNIGLKRIRKMPTLPEKQINFQYDAYSNIDPNQLPYPICTGFCRGQDGRQRVFVLIKLDCDFHQITLCKIALLIINRFPLGTIGKMSGIPEQSYVTLMKLEGSEAYQVLPPLRENNASSDETMSEEQLQLIADLLDGKNMKISNFDGCVLKRI